MSSFVLWVLGKPGAGKGTLCNNIKKSYEVYHISAGEVLRNTDDKDIQNIIKNGNLVPALKVVQLLSKEENKAKGQIIVHDGFPRSLERYLLAKDNFRKTADLVIWLTAKDNTAVDRIKRRTALETDKRGDSNTEAIRNRLHIYKQQTIPLLEVFRQDNLEVIEIDTENRSPTQIFEIASSKINKILKFSNNKKHLEFLIKESLK